MPMPGMPVGGAAGSGADVMRKAMTGARVMPKPAPVRTTPKAKAR
jgi:hypothetical protein